MSPVIMANSIPRLWALSLSQVTVVWSVLDDHFHSKCVGRALRGGILFRFVGGRHADLHRSRREGHFSVNCEWCDSHCMDLMYTVTLIVHRLDKWCWPRFDLLRSECRNLHRCSHQSKLFEQKRIRLRRFWLEVSGDLRPCGRCSSSWTECLFPRWGVDVLLRYLWYSTSKLLPW